MSADQAMIDPHDRQVAAVLPDGAEIVRYDRAGHYFIEWPPTSGTNRRRLKIGEAARLAVESNARILRGSLWGFQIEVTKALKAIAAENK
jgi:pimeloyl-ACP methyl ester carboxylesterase